jgi:hypothetical protein
MSYGDLNKNTVYTDKWQFDEFTASRGSADTGKFTRARYVTARKQSCTQCTGNPAGNSKRTQDWLKKNLMEKEIWPPSSPACSPVDYFTWGVSE